MVGLAGQLAEVALDHSAGLFAVRGEDRLSVPLGNLSGDVVVDPRRTWGSARRFFTHCLAALGGATRL